MNRLTVRIATGAALLTLLAARPAPLRAEDKEKPKAESVTETEAEKSARERRRAFMRPQESMTVDGKKIRLSWGPIEESHADYAAIAKLREGDVLPLTSTPAIKLMTEIDLAFGGVVVREGNVAPDYPGVYGLWLKKTKTGWSLVFNRNADAWGTMHFAQADAAEVPLTLGKNELAKRQLTFKLEAAGADGGSLNIHWGDHHWSAPFTASSSPAASAASAPAESDPATAAESSGTAADYAAMKNPAPFNAASISQGKAVYLRYCQQCHGQDGRALENIDFEATDLTAIDTYYYGKSDGEIFRSIREGAGKDMPPFRDKLEDEQMWHLVNHIRDIGPAAHRPKQAN